MGERERGLANFETLVQGWIFPKTARRQIGNLLRLSLSFLASEVAKHFFYVTKLLVAINFI